MRLVYGYLTLCFVALLSTTGQAQIDTGTAQRLGLESAWKSQAQIPLAGSGLVSSHLWPSPENPRRYAVVELENQTIRISADQLGDDNEPIGIEEAKNRARQQASKLLGRTDGFQVVEVSVPQLKLVLFTDDGLVQTFDAESGELLWAQSCGRSTAPSFPGAVSPVGISIIHGANLYVLDWETGEIKMSQPLRYASSNAVAVCDDIAFVSDFTGRVQAYSIGQRKLLPWSYVIQGRAIGPTANLDNQSFCAMASDDGFVYVFAGGEVPSIYLRYETSSAITGSLAPGNNAFYAGTAGGLISKITVDDRLGSVKWSFRVSATVTAPPLVIGKRVYAASEGGDLVSIDDETGLANWATTDLLIRQPLAEADDTLYCFSLTNQLVAIDASTGAIRGRTQPLTLSRPVPNQINDRLYVVTKFGQIQCLRPAGAILPTMVTPYVPPAEEEGAEGATAVPSTAQEADTESSPFGFGEGAQPGSNPFGAPAEGSEATDPFGTGGDSDPFGAPAGGDPFGAGGGSDPFGGSSGADENPFGEGDPFSSGN